MIPLSQHEQVKFALLLVLTVSSGCDDGKGASAAQSACKAYCEKLELCDDRTDHTGCQSDCVAETFRSNTYFTARQRCAEELSCNRLEARGAELEDCIGDDLRTRTAPEEAQGLCEALANHLADCENDVDSDAVSGQCARTAVTLSDPYLSESEACAEERCEDMQSCFRNLADAYDTNISLYPDI